MSTTKLAPVWEPHARKKIDITVQGEIIEVGFYNDGHTQFVRIDCTSPEHAQLIAAHLHNSLRNPESFKHFNQIKTI